MTLEALHQQIIACRSCPRLVAWREQVAEEKRAAFRNWEYWGKPLPGFGDPAAGLLVVGLAPAAHGGNRTGRIFTGDRSGDFLFAALHRAGFASQPTSTHRGDGLALSGAYVLAVVRCVPPANRPTTQEIDECSRWLEAEVRLLPDVRVVLALGAVAFTAALRLAASLSWGRVSPVPRFAHGGEVDLRPGGPLLIASFHPSQQNTFTGRLTEQMMDQVMARARGAIDGHNYHPAPS